MSIPLRGLLPPSSFLSYSTEENPSDADICPICHETVVADRVTFSCHTHVPYCADCVAAWVWRCVCGDQRPPPRIQLGPVPELSAEVIEAHRARQVIQTNQLIGFSERVIRTLREFQAEQEESIRRNQDAPLANSIALGVQSLHAQLALQAQLQEMAHRVPEMARQAQQAARRTQIALQNQQRLEAASEAHRAQHGSRISPVPQRERRPLGATCPHCRNLINVDEGFLSHRGRWLSETTAGVEVDRSGNPTGRDEDWYDQYLANLRFVSFITFV